jgi:acyl-coenzyme A synthetase/AMP-(fatty) acid ligase
LVSFFTEQRTTIVRHNLAYPFYESALARPERLALSVGETQFTYSALREQVQPIAHWPTHSPSNAPRVGILASRTPGTYFGFPGTCWAGGTYIPLGSKYPEERLLQHFERIAPEALVVDANGMALLAGRVLSRGPRNILAPGIPASCEPQLEGGATDDPALKTQIKKRLPSYMAPSTVHRIESIPLNASGKVHRQDGAELVVQGKLNAAS